jgi:hypothetical protein
MAKMDSSINSNFQKLLNCNWILYVVFFLAASDLYIFAVNGELFYVSLFVLIGILTTFFSKNMTVILLIAMTLTNILRFGKDVRVKEGMEDGAETDAAAEVGAAAEDPDIQTDKGDDYQFLEKKETGAASAKAAPAKKPAIIESLTQDSAAAAAPVAADAVSSKKAKSADSGELNLENLKLEDLDQDTMNLLQKQKSLMTSMRTLEPMLTKAESFLEKFKNM